MSISLKFNVSPEYPEEFPRSRPLLDTEALSYRSFGELFQKTQEAYLPYYNVAVVESGNEKERFYQVYDTAYFSRIINQTIDPITRRRIRKVHYFVAKCFDFDKSNICRPVDLQTDIILSPIQINERFFKKFLDSTNVNALETGKSDQWVLVRKIQRWIATSLIKTGEVFLDLTEENRKIEVLKWLWCSAHGYYQGLTEFVQECLKNTNFISNPQEQAFEILRKELFPPSSVQEKTSAKERRSLKDVAIDQRRPFIEALMLFEQLEKEKEESKAE